MKTGLTFHWPDYRKVSFAVPGFILLSLLLHGVAFTLFQVVYPPSGMLRPPPAGITLLTPSTPENRALLQWIAAGDPALSSQPQEVTPPGLLEQHYQPSYGELYTEPKPAELPVENIRMPSLIDSQGLIAAVSRQSPAATIPSLACPTQMRFSPELANRKSTAGEANQKPVNFQFKTHSSLEPAQFLVGVNPSGEVGYIFLEHSSGEPKIDREAESMIGKSHFEPGKETTWGMVCFCWGNDVFTTGSQSERMP